MADKIFNIGGIDRLFPETFPGSGVFLLGTSNGAGNSNPTMPPAGATGIASAARTTSANTGLVTLPGYKGVLFHWRVTAAPGSPTGNLTFRWEAMDETDLSLSTFTLYNFQTTQPAINAVGSYQYLYYPGAGVGTGAVVPQSFSGIKQVMGLVAPARWRAVIAHSNGTDSYTYSLAYTPIP